MKSKSLLTRFFWFMSSLDLDEITIVGFVVAAMAIFLTLYFYFKFC